MFRLFLLVLVSAVFAAPASAEYELEIGPDTTVIDGPLNPDGTINYLAYLNEKLSEGVTPENNFAVDVAMTMGEDAWPDHSYRDQVWAWFKLRVPGDAPTFPRFASYMESRDPSQPQAVWLEQVQQATKNPWSADRFPEVKKWLEEHAAALELIERGSSKSRFAMPMFVEEGQQQAVFMAMLPHLGQVRFLGQAFAARAQMRLHNQDFEGAWSDVVVMHRIADLTSMQPEFLCRLIGISVHNMALDVTDSLLASDAGDTKIYRRVIKDSASLSPCRGMKDAIDIGARLGILNALLHGRAGHLRGDILSDATCRLITQEQFDGNLALRKINQRMDRITEIAEIDDPLERVKAFEDVDHEVGELVEQTRKMLKGDTAAIESMRELIEESNIYTVGGLYLLIGDTFPRTASYARVRASTQMRIDLRAVAFAIATYYADRGQFPDDLQGLVPVYLHEIPTDFATGELPVYRVEDGVALVYSLGTNLKDDGGVDDVMEGDIVFRVER